MEYQWDLNGDGRYIEVEPSQDPQLYIDSSLKDVFGEKVMKKYFTKGKHFVNLRVIDEDGVTGEDTVLVSIEESGGHPPLVDLAGAPYYTVVGDKFIVSCANSIEMDDGEMIKRRGILWDVNGDGKFEEFKGTNTIELSLSLIHI